MHIPISSPPTPTTLPKGFWPAWITTLLFFAAFYTLLVPLPLYLKQIGLPDWQIGIILGAFGIASLLSRPLSGILADRWGCRPIMLSGAASATIGALGLGCTAQPLLLFSLRILQTAGYVTFTTSATALIADISPAAQRGRTLAVFGVAANLAMTCTPALINLGLASYPLTWAFFCSGALAALCGVLAFTLLPSAPARAPQKIAGQPLFHLPVPLRLPMLITAVFGVGFGAFFQFAPLLTTQRAIGSSGLAYTVYGLSIIATRVAGGKLLDQAHRHRVLLPAFVILAFGLGGLASAPGAVSFYSSVMLVAVASGILHPALIALHVEHSAKTEYGRATSIFYLGFDLGIGLGAWLLSPALQLSGVPALFGLAALFMLAGVALVRRVLEE
jgi:MFS family permease